ncbi:cation:proton antiporter [Sandaracinus amylolyticus]|uniref:Na+/H+ antiporter n=1 Tax=Sandaracinus amylolyticus TaxID=927083 RepID=A0A0F6SDJ1_9BACT|nr:sodium:proton antiporter [Sandaracinus amylolyticus]AKF03534.1 Na+/H+ antiporter [Sandaracinus amylolyticus]
METFEIVVALVLAGAALTAVSRRIGAPYPATAALVGAVIAMLPGAPEIVLDPELALTLFVAPLLIDAAFDASPRDLRASWRAVSGLALGAVVLTVAVVAIVVRALVPSMPWPAAIALGAIVAPPDAAAATTVLRQLRPPHRILVVLEGESLFNDASALLIYRLAIGAALAGSLALESVIPMLLVVSAGSVVLGLVLARAVLWITARIDDVALAVVVQFGATFGVWMLAERLHLSGILVLVVFAMAYARRAGDVIPARVRVPSYAVWELAVFVLTVLAFTLVGLQLEAIVGRMSASLLLEHVAIATAVCVATIVARIVWVSGAALVQRRAGASALPPRAAALVGWCGMRGITTLAVALALPGGVHGEPAFPHRDLILFCAFAVVLGTLVVQGLTLGPLARALRLEDDGEVDRETALARAATLRAAIAATDAHRGAQLAELLRHRFEVMLSRVEHQRPSGEPHDAIVVQAAIDAERRHLLALRADGTIGDAAFQRVERELDLEELHLEPLASRSR